mgnify:CR=1 FL=1
MPKRNLTNEEIILTKKGIKNKEEELIKLKKERDIRSIIRDIITPYNIEIEDKNIKDLIDRLEE